MFPGGGGGGMSRFSAGGELSAIPPVGKILEHSVSFNPLVLPGAVPASLMEGFIFPDINIKGKKTPTKFHLIQAINI